MNAAIVSRTLSLIPDRVARVQSGCLFDLASATCAHPERIAHLAQFLNWLGPLHPITKEDLRIFGLMTPYGKPAIDPSMNEDADSDAEVADAELEADAEIAVDAMQQPAIEPVEHESALT